jgi:hypothetical protein
MSKDYRITTILGSILVYFILVAFCLSQSVRSGVADDPNGKEGKDGAFMGDGVLAQLTLSCGISTNLSYF